MAKRTLLLASGLVLLGAMVLIASIGEKHTAVTVAEPQTLQPPASRAPCSFNLTSGSAVSFWSGYEAGVGTYTYFDAAAWCAPPVYPFAITDFSFTLYDPGGYTWPAEVDIVIYYPAVGDDSCSGPGAEVCRHGMTADQATYGYPTVGTYTFPAPCCVTGPFFIGLEYSAGQTESTPSVLFDDQTVDTCQNWMYYTDGLYYEWHTFWNPPPPGYPIFYVDGETELPECQCSWEPGDPYKMHYPQLPDELGWDVNATQPLVLADDWMCSDTGWVKDIHFWGSWKHGIEGQILYFVLSIHEDIPADPPQIPYSRPGITLWEREVSNFNATPRDPPSMEGWYDPSTGEVIPDDHQAYFQYDVCFDNPDDWFWQEEGVIYWLNISAVVADPIETQWGWKSTQDHWNDDAVWAFWDELNWIDLWEPYVGDPIVNTYGINIHPGGLYQWGWGEGHYGAPDTAWYYYPATGWWNIWFYDHPFTYDRLKEVSIYVEIYKPIPQEPSFIEFALNYSTDWWSIEGQPPGDSMPPLPGFPEDLAIVRVPLMVGEVVEGPHVFDTVLFDYNPEWVSIDVRGENFMIEIGSIAHDCVPRQQSLDLAFVITGEAPEEMGACCHDTSGLNNLCMVTTQAYCETVLGGVYQGDGTSCTGTGPEACCLPNGDCVMADPLCCVNELNGVPQGDGSSCTALEACCLPNGDCQMLDPLCCVQQGGVPQGAGTVCTAREACCLPGGNCVMLDPLCCDDQGGVPQGAGTACTQPEPCCFIDGSCAMIDPLCCDDEGGTPSPIGAATCLGDNDGDGVDDACQGGWVPGDPHKMHYPQLPDSSGWDVMATFPIVLADDWRCSETGLIKDIHFWGSWMGDIEGIIDSFHLSVHKDIPADQSPTGYSMPGELIWERDYRNFGVVVTELPANLQGWYDPAQGVVIPNDHSRFYQYNVILDSLDWFRQTMDSIYWLDVTAFVRQPSSALWGWKSTDWHFNDDATMTFWGEPDWYELYEPPGPSQPITNFFWVEVDPTGVVTNGGGDHPYGDGWYFYPSGWWNIWFYDHPFSYYRQKVITISLDVLKFDPGLPSEVVIAVNHSTDWWSLEGNPPGEPRRPPLPGDDEPVSIVRDILIAGPDLEGHFDFEWYVPQYNPEWVSIDIMGYNFVIPEGIFVHECIAQDSVSLDLSFVMTGEATSCCDHDGIRGDVNYDFNGPNIVDLTYLVAYLFGSPPGPAPPCFEEGDVNGDGTINIVDLTHLVAFLFSGGPPPAPCP